MVVNKSLRDAIGVTQCDEVRVTMKLDDQSRTVEIPEDFHDVDPIQDGYKVQRFNFRDLNGHSLGVCYFPED